MKRALKRASELFWHWPDRNIDWLQSLDVIYIERAAWLFALAGVLLFVWAPFTNEPFLIYSMSAGAIIGAGVSWLGALQAKRAVDEAEDDGP